MRKGKCQISHWFMRVSMKSCSQYFNGGRGTQRRSPENQILEHWRVSVCYKSLRSLAVFKYRTQSYINYSWIFKKFTVIQLIYNVLLIFALQQSNSVLRVCVCVCTRACMCVVRRVVVNPATWSFPIVHLQKNFWFQFQSMGIHLKDTY